MAEEVDIVNTLKQRGVTCSRLKAIESRERKEAGDFRKMGFENIANVQEQTANKLKELRDKVCKLR